ncbi:MAG: hypothetical protein VCD00_03285 [Candidatus Hydrogenedentota bacterium]
MSTMAFLAAREDANALLVQTVLDALYTNDLRADRKLPTLIPYSEAEQWRIFPMHEASLSYFTPYKGLENFGALMQFLAGAKEILLSIAAGLYLLWRRRDERMRKFRERALLNQNRIMHEHLTDTLRIEEQQMEESSPAKLKERLNEVTRIKLQAIEELTH